LNKFLLNTPLKNFPRLYKIDISCIVCNITGTRCGKTFPTKADAQSWLRKMQYKLDQGYDLEGGKILLGDYLIQWLENYKIAIRPKTYHRYKGLLQKHVIPHIGKISLNNLHPFTIEQLYADLLEIGVGVRSIRHAHAVLHHALEKAVGYGLLMSNPAHRVTLPQYKPAEIQVLNDSQVSLFLTIAETSKYKALYHLAVTTGMRQGELFGLKWTDIHWNSAILQVQRQVQRVPGEGWSFSEPKTKTGHRSIQLGNGTITALREQYQLVHHLKSSNEQRWQEYNLIFPSSVGAPLNASNLRKDFLRLLSDANLPTMRFHDLRHTAASLMLNHGVPLIVVSRILGHAKPSITLDIYGHLIHEMQGEAAKIMDELVTPIRINISQNEPIFPQKA